MVLARREFLHPRRAVGGNPQSNAHPDSRGRCKHPLFEGSNGSAAGRGPDASGAPDRCAGKPGFAETPGSNSAQSLRN